MSELGCRETLRELERYVDGECLRELTVQVEEHLAGCSDCTDHAEFRRRLKVVVSRKCGPEPLPEGLVEKLHDLLRDPDAPSSV